MSNRGFIAVLAAIAFVGLLGFGLIAKNTDRPEVGQPMPDAPVEVLGEDGEERISDYRGQWVLVNLWASWCDPCRDEAPALEAFSQRHRDDLVVLGIATEDATGDALAFAREYDITYQLLHDGDGSRKDALGATGIPESYLVDPDGAVAAIKVGPVDEEVGPDKQSWLDATVAPLIGGGA